MSQHVSVTAPKCPLCLGSDTVKLNGLRAMCRQCSKSRRRVYSFCWACQREWPKKAEAEASCNLDRCALRAALLSDECITEPHSSAKGCPFFRACPECNTLVTHNGVGCPNVRCPQCRKGFCFRCLRRVCYGMRARDFQTILRELQLQSQLESQRVTRLGSWLESWFQPRVEPRLEPRLEPLEVWRESLPEPCTIVDNSRSLEALRLQEQS
ncbi:uncharacterized protein LOC143518419 isoform X2 [Brachyhypopomus gauderio]|uniref:uncharacterized protein LOC143518419 isoform X2 n=1 Tax=Brachyhypopomus gauderio TaxID=698409 RepID=UPI0040435746